MLGSLNGCACSLNGLGATETTLPDHYLVPMTKLEIDAYIYQERGKGKYSKLNAGCEDPLCFLVMLEIERGNMYYVNGIITWEQLQEVYSTAKKALEAIPRMPTIAQQLKDIGTFVVGTVTGLITGGPVGLFVGGAAATRKIIADARARVSGEALELLNPEIQKAKEGAVEMQKLQAGLELKASLPWLIGTAFAVAGFLFFGEDLKKLLKA